MEAIDEIVEIVFTSKTPENDFVNFQMGEFVREDFFLCSMCEFKNQNVACE